MQRRQGTIACQQHFFQIFHFHNMSSYLFVKREILFVHKHRIELCNAKEKAGKRWQDSNLIHPLSCLLFSKSMAMTMQ